LLSSPQGTRPVWDSPSIDDGTLILYAIEDAVNNAITRAGKTIRNMKWFEVAEIRGHLENNKVADWQVTVKVGFTLDT